MSTFAELGLGDDLVEAAAAIGWRAPLPIQRAAIPVLRRGGNALLRASSGAGITGAYGLALLDRLSGSEVGEGARALILVSSESRAAEVASQLSQLAGENLQVRAVAPGWRSGFAADVVVATPAAAAKAVERSSLKLGALQVLVLEAVPALLAGAADALDTVLVSVPSEAQRVLTTPEWTRDVDRFAEAHARRAMSIPSRPADPDAAGVAAPAGTVSYVVVPARSKEVVLGRLLERDEHRVVLVRGEERARAVRSSIRARGHASGGEGVSVATWGEKVEGPAVGFDVPPDADALAGLDASTTVIVVDPSELQHLRAVAADARLSLQALPVPTEPRSGLASFRDEIRRALSDEDIDAQLLVLEPLFEEHSPAEVAAALSALLRHRRPVERKPAAAEPVSEARSRAFVRLFVSAGQKDGLRPAEIIGAFASEAGITGEQVGRIEIRETFSVVEVDPQVADKVIRAVNGTTLRGRSVRVDFDRKGAPTPRRRPPGPRPPAR